MDTTVVDIDRDGRVRLESASREEEEWSVPTLQEKRAILYAAAREIDALTELVEILQDDKTAGLRK